MHSLGISQSYNPHKTPGIKVLHIFSLIFLVNRYVEKKKIIALDFRPILELDPVKASPSEP